MYTIMALEEFSEFRFLNCTIDPQRCWLKVWIQLKSGYGSATLGIQFFPACSWFILAHFLTFQEVNTRSYISVPEPYWYYRPYLKYFSLCYQDAPVQRKTRWTRPVIPLADSAGRSLTIKTKNKDDIRVPKKM